MTRCATLPCGWRLVLGRGAKSLLVAVLGGFGAIAAHAADVPFLTGRVVDNAEIISPAVRERLTRALKDCEDKTGAQIAVLTIPTLGGDSIEDYAVRVFQEWKLGQKGKDNGALVVVAPHDRKMRIEVGYGLEGTLTDVAASRIIRNVMTPHFKDNDYDKGIEDGVAAIVGTIEGRSDAVPADVAQSSAKRSSGSLDISGPDIAWPMRILLGAFIFGIIGIFTFVGIVTPGVGWFLYVFLIPFWAMFPIVVLGVKGALALLGVYVIGFPVAKLWLSHTPWYQKAARELKTTGHTSVGGMVLSSGGGSSGSSGGGGFSGGGGSSGGGGASGSW